MRKTRPVQVKNIQIGGGAPVVIQSMTKTDTSDVGATVAQIEEMVRAGCEIVRLAVPDNDAAVALKEIRKRVPDVPIVADIHFHYKLALLPATSARTSVFVKWCVPRRRRKCRSGLG
jgi:(E)-4-hydroxy-3-methylbut-2-enyl-diphosphate synthase